MHPEIITLMKVCCWPEEKKSYLSLLFLNVKRDRFFMKKNRFLMKPTQIYNKGSG